MPINCNSTIKGLFSKINTDLLWSVFFCLMVSCETHHTKTVNPCVLSVKRRHQLLKDTAFFEKGIASRYHPSLQNQRTASGESYDSNALTAAHKSLPLGEVITVVNSENGHSIQVLINDRGPFIANRIIDLSQKAADSIGLSEDQGVGSVILLQTTTSLCD